MRFLMKISSLSSILFRICVSLHFRFFGLIKKLWFTKKLIKRKRFGKDCCLDLLGISKTAEWLLLSRPSAEFDIRSSFAARTRSQSKSIPQLIYVSERSSNETAEWVLLSHPSAEFWIKSSFAARTRSQSKSIPQLICISERRTYGTAEWVLLVLFVEKWCGKVSAMLHSRVWQKAGSFELMCIRIFNFEPKFADFSLLKAIRKEAKRV